MKLLRLPLRDNPYTIHIGSSLIEDTDLLSAYCFGNNVLIVSNDIVAPLYIETLSASLQSKTLHQLIIKDGEINKSKESFFEIIDYLIENNFRRNDTLVALGGGVIGDLSGFVAASYQRGMNLIQVPTSLLSQVDSSVGGKTAINHPLGKNLIGAFYQPNAVIIDVSSLNSLPDREYFSGFGEIVKYAILGEKKIQQLLTEQTQKIIQRDEETLKEIIYLSCQMKASIVEKDEKEKGERALLNLGHTFAHALETITQYQHYLHGEAVSIGILMALSYSQKKGYIEQAMVEEYKSLFQQLNLPTKINLAINTDDFLLAMCKDKKNQSEKYRLVLVKEKKCVIQEENDQALLLNTIKEYMPITPEDAGLS